MVFDKQVILSDAQAIVATAFSTNVIDLQAMGIAAYNSIQLVRKLIGHKIPFVVLVNEAFNNLTSLTVNYQSSSDEVFTSPVNEMSVVVPVAQLAVGYHIPMVSLPHIGNRYFRLQYVVTGAAPTTGKITAGVVAAVDDAYVG